MKYYVTASTSQTHWIIAGLIQSKIKIKILKYRKHDLKLILFIIAIYRI